jgi:uncharacterized membrane protein
MESLFRLKASIICAVCVLSLTWSIWSLQPLDKYVTYGGMIKEQLPLCSDISHCLSPQEFAHLRDVQVLLQYSYFLLSLALLILRSTTQKQHKLFLFTIYIFTALIFLFNFEPVFTLFHYLFFPQGNWAFSANSYLIQHYPSAVWLSSFIGLLFGSFFINILIVKKLT